MRSQGIDSFQMIILDVQIGKENAEKSENFFTIYFNRDINAKTQYGYDLSVNRYYNRIVGDLYALSGDEHPGYVEGIYFDDLNHYIEKGYSLRDLSVLFGVHVRTIDCRIKAYYSDQFGSDVSFNEVAKYLRTKKLIEYYSQGLQIEEIVKKFVTFDVAFKGIAFSNPIEVHKQYLIGKIPERIYSEQGVRFWTTDYLGMKSTEAYEQYFVKPIVISLLQSGFEMREALELFEAMGITNPWKKGDPYNAKTLWRLVKTRLWGQASKSWNDMRDIFLEPIIENLVRRGAQQKTIEQIFDRSGSFINAYMNRRWGFTSYEALKNFFATNYLGRHEVNDYLD